MKKVKPDLLVLIFILGILLSLQYRVMTSGYKYIKIQDLYILKNEVKRDKAEIELLSNNIIEKKKELDDYKADSSSSVSVESKLREDLRNKEAYIGMRDVAGEGVIVIITDSSQSLTESDDPMDMVVHDVDLKNVVNDLIASGAEAVSINNQRVLLSQRQIVCNGPTIRVNNKLLAQPYIIKAIGDKDYLEASITAPGKYGNMLKEWGLFVEVNSSSNVFVPAYNSSFEPKYLKKAEGEIKK